MYSKGYSSFPVRVYVCLLCSFLPPCVTRPRNIGTYSFTAMLLYMYIYAAIYFLNIINPRYACAARVIVVVVCVCMYVCVYVCVYVCMYV